MLCLQDRIGRLVSPYRGLGPSLWSMFAGTMVNRFGDFVSAFLALYLSRCLGFGAAKAGLVVAAAMGASALGSLVSGRIADSLGRKPCLVACHLCAASFDMAMSFLYERPWAPALVIAGSFFRGGVRPLIAALIVDIAPAERRKEAFTLQYLSINVGVAIGPMVAAFLFERAMPWLFRGDAICTIAAALLVARGVVLPGPRADVGAAVAGAAAAAGAPTKGASPEASASTEARDERGALRAFAARPILLAYCGLALLSNVTYAQTGFSLPLSISERIGEGGPSFFGLMISLNALIVLALSLSVSRALGRRSPLSCMALSGLLYFIAFGVLALPLGGSTQGKLAIVSSTIVWTLGEIVMAVNMGVFVARHSPENWRGSFQSFIGMFQMCGSSLGPLVAGPVIAAAGHSALWALTAALCAIWGFGALALDGKDRNYRVGTFS
jgi:MFS family permease